jgi:hypothetical protein
MDKKKSNKVKPDDALLKKAKSTLGAGQKKNGGKKKKGDKGLKEATSKVVLESRVIAAWEHGDVEETDGPTARYSSTQASEAVTSQAETASESRSTPPEGAQQEGLSSSPWITGSLSTYQASMVDDDDDEEEDWDSLIASVMGDEEQEEVQYARMPRKSKQRRSYLLGDMGVPGGVEEMPSSPEEAELTGDCDPPYTFDFEPSHGVNPASWFQCEDLETLSGSVGRDSLAVPKSRFMFEALGGEVRCEG